MTVPSHVQLTTTNVFNQTIPAVDPVDQGILGSMVLQGADVIGGICGHIQESFEGAHDLIGTEDPQALAALGFTAAFSIVSGGLNVKSGYEEEQNAREISDVAGRAIACLKMANGTLVAGSGAAFLPAKAVSIAALSSSAKVLGTVAGILGKIGGAFFAGASVFAAIAQGIKLDEQREFRLPFHAILEDSNFSEEERALRALEYLKKMVSVSASEKEQILREIEADPELAALGSDEKAALVSDKAQLLLEKKEAFISRVLNEDCLKLIRETGPDEAGSVIEAVKKESLKNVVLLSCSIALLGIGLAVTIAALICTGPLGIIITTAIGLTVSLSWICLDSYSLIEEFQKSEPGRFDKLWIFLSTVIAVVSVATVFFLSGGTAPMIAAAVVGAIWLAINVACYWRLSQFEKQKQLEVELQQLT